jgi:hypothetical protein
MNRSCWIVISRDQRLLAGPVGTDAGSTTAEQAHLHGPSVAFVLLVNVLK